MNPGQTVFGSESLCMTDENGSIDDFSIFSIHLASQPNYVLGHEGKCDGDGNKIILWLCNESGCSKWEVKPLGDSST